MKRSTGVCDPLLCILSEIWCFYCFPIHARELLRAIYKKITAIHVGGRWVVTVAGLWTVSISFPGISFSCFHANALASAPMLLVIEIYYNIADDAAVSWPGINSCVQFTHPCVHHLKSYYMFILIIFLIFKKIKIFTRSRRVATNAR